MLYITRKIRQVDGTYDERQSSWHVGETMPVVHSRVVTFQADGDELEIIIAAIKAASKKPVTIITLPPAETGPNQLPMAPDGMLEGE